MNVNGISGSQLSDMEIAQSHPAANDQLLDDGQRNIWDMPQGIVSISPEGKKMLEESQKGTEENYDQLTQIEKTLEEIGKNNTEGKRTADTDNEYDEAMEALRKLREDQAKQYEEEAEEAKKRAMANSKHLSDMEKGNRDLVIMLESFKGLNEDKKAKHSAKKDRPDHAGDSDREESIKNISGQIRSEAAAKEEGMDAVLNDIHKKAQDGFSRAGKIGKDIRKQLDELKDFVSDAANSMKEKESAVAEFAEYSEPLLKEMQDTRMVAIQRMKIYKAVSLERLGNQNMIKANRAQEEVTDLAHNAAVADAFDAAYESRQRDKIDDLEERIKELQGIDSAPAVGEEEENPLIPENAVSNLSEEAVKQKVDKDDGKESM